MSTLEHKYDFDLGEEMSSHIRSDETNWLFTYMDILTLLLSLFIFLMTYANFEEPCQPSDIPNREQYFEQMNLPILPPPKAEAPQALTKAPELTLPPKLESLVQVKWVGNQANLEISDTILFASADSKLTFDGEELLLNLKAIIKEHPGDVIIEGHTDSEPISNEFYPSNWELSAARASSVVRYFIDNGIEKNKFQIIGYADTKPLEEASNQQQNRRVTIVLVVK